jgi:CRISPR-associated protein Cmr1
MQSLSVTLKIITPLFLGGAEPRGEPELRPASFRGALRFWWRAAFGGVVGEDLDKLRSAEASIFGSNEKGSSLVIRLTPMGSTASAEYVKQRAIRRPGGRPQPTGRDYLFWSMASTGRQERGNYQPPHRYITPDTKFKLTLQARPGAPNGKVALQEGAAALWLLVHLGALGSRSRRCAGSLAATNESTTPLNDLSLRFSTPRTPGELKGQLEKGLRDIANALAGRHTPNQQNALAAFDILRPGHCRIWIVSDRQAWRNATDAVEAMGTALRDFRSAENAGRADHDAMLDWFERRQEPATIQRAAFGLPIPFRYSHGGPSDTIQAIARGGDVRDRRASPLCMRVSQLSSGEHVGVIVLFKSAFLAGGDKLQLRNKRWKTDPPPDYTFVERFVTHQFPRKWEVRL